MFELLYTSSSWLHSLPFMVFKALGDRLRSAVGVAVIGCGALCSPTSLRLVAGPSSLPDVTGVVS